MFRCFPCFDVLLGYRGFVLPTDVIVRIWQTLGLIFNTQQVVTQVRHLSLSELARLPDLSRQLVRRHHQVALRPVPHLALDLVVLLLWMMGVEHCFPEPVLMLGRCWGLQALL